MTRLGKVNPYLVGSAGLRADADKSPPADALNNLPLRYRRARTRGIFAGHFLAVARASPYAGGKNARVFFHLPAHHRLVFLAHFALRKLARKGGVAQVVFCRHQNAGGVFVQAVDDAGPLNSAESGKVFPIPPGKRPRKRGPRPPGPRMNGQAGGAC